MKKHTHCQLGGCTNPLRGKQRKYCCHSHCVQAAQKRKITAVEPVEVVAADVFIARPRCLYCGEQIEPKDKDGAYHKGCRAKRNQYADKYSGRGV